MNTAMHAVNPEEIMALLDGELVADRVLFTSAHMENCGECRELAEALHGSSQLLSSWTIPLMSESSEFGRSVTEVADQRSSALRSEGGIRWIPLFRRHWVLTATASAVATAAFLIFASTGIQRLEKAPATYSHPVDLARANDALVEPPGMAGPEDRFSRADSPSGSPSTLGKLQERLALQQQSRTLSKGWVQNGPMIARTISLSLITNDFSTSRASLDAILLRHHGYAAGVTVSTEPNAARFLQASLRIPAGELNAAVLELKSLGRVQNESQNGEEVTQQHADLVARLKNSRETEERLQDILRNRTGKISDVLAVEQEIARVRGEIEQMEAEQKALEHRVDFATVELRLSEEYKAQLDSPSPSIATRFHNASVAGYRSAAETVIGALLFLTEFGPALLIWLVILVPVPWLLWRRWRRGMITASAAH